MASTIHDTAYDGDLDALAQRLLDPTLDINGFDSYGTTPLMRAAWRGHFDAVALLIEHGADLELRSESGRTALYMAAELCNDDAMVPALVDLGAEFDIEDSHGNHVLVNTMSEVVHDYLARKCGRASTFHSFDEAASVRLSATEWRRMKVSVDAVFASLTLAGFLAVRGRANSQDEVLDQCAELQDAGHADGKTFVGYCFTTKQDDTRARNGDPLAIGFGVADGPDDPVAVGRLIVAAFVDAGFTVDWPESAGVRPLVLRT